MADAAGDRARGRPDVDLSTLLRDAPTFHVDEGLRPCSLQASLDVLETLDGAVRPGTRTVETGTGFSTVVFALRGAEHVSITPAVSEVDRVRAYCGSRAIELDNVRFEVGRSEHVLPTLGLSELDVVLIDGGHGFPTPFVDWFYTAEALRVGGLMVIDDVHLWTGRVLRDFLAVEPGWALRSEFPRAVVFEKTHAMPELPEWFEQPFVRRRSPRGGRVGHLVRKTWALLRSARTSPHRSPSAARGTARPRRPSR